MYVHVVINKLFRDFFDGSKHRNLGLTDHEVLELLLPKVLLYFLYTYTDNVKQP